MINEDAEVNEINEITEKYVVDGHVVDYIRKERRLYFYPQYMCISKIQDSLKCSELDAKRHFHRAYLSYKEL